MKKVQLTHEDFHSIVMSPLRKSLTDSFRSLLNQGFVIEILNPVAPHEIMGQLTTLAEFETWFDK